MHFANIHIYNEVESIISVQIHNINNDIVQHSELKAGGSTVVVFCVAAVAGWELWGAQG